jgi:hypothetical protein
MGKQIRKIPDVVWLGGFQANRCAIKRKTDINIRTGEETTSNQIKYTRNNAEVVECLKDCQGVFHSIMAHRGCYDFSRPLDKLSALIKKLGG